VRRKTSGLGKSRWFLKHRTRYERPGAGSKAERVLRDPGFMPYGLRYPILDGSGANLLGEDTSLVDHRSLSQSFRAFIRPVAFPHTLLTKS
jgi:hypothetical protein